MPKSCQEISSLRTEYGLRILRRKDLATEPIEQFDLWLKQAIKEKLTEPTAFILSTLGIDGYPESRTLLLKFFDQKGFVFFTNYKSAKGKEISNHPQASLLFPWFGLERQVRIVGKVEKVSKTQSLKYFASRPPESQIGAWVSNQSSVIDSRSLLENKIAEIKAKFKKGKIPLPDFWGGYRLEPIRMEFWQGGHGRVHDRFLYTLLDGGGWSIERLAP